MLANVNTMTFPIENEAELDRGFDFKVVKLKVLHELEDTLPIVFKRFCDSVLFDRFVLTLALHFLTNFQREALVRFIQRISLANIQGFHLTEHRQRVLDLEIEAQEHLKNAGPLYGSILLKYGTYKNPHNDRTFFETLYRVLIAIQSRVFSKLEKDQEIEVEVGRLFRNACFNVSERKHAMPRSVDTLSLQQLYEIKHGTQNASLNAKILTELYKKRQNLDTKKASLTRSPLLEELLKPENTRAMWSQISSSREGLSSPKSSPRQETTIERSEIHQTLLEDENTTLLEDIRSHIESILFSTISPNSTNKTNSIPPTFGSKHKSK